MSDILQDAKRAAAHGLSISEYRRRRAAQTKAAVDPAMLAFMRAYAAAMSKNAKRVAFGTPQKSTD